MRRSHKSIYNVELYPKSPALQTMHMHVSVCCVKSVFGIISSRQCTLPTYRCAQACTYTHAVRVPQFKTYRTDRRGCMCDHTSPPGRYSPSPPPKVIHTCSFLKKHMSHVVRVFRQVGPEAHLAGTLHHPPERPLIAPVVICGVAALRVLHMQVYMAQICNAVSYLMHTSVKWMSAW